MNSIDDLKNLTSPIYSDPIIVHRLRIMRYSRRPNHNMPIIRLFDNCLRKKIDRLYCWRRNKYVTRLGLYYWINQHDENCQECKRVREPEWHGFESSFIMMMKANPINGGGLDFARMAAGLKTELSCFGAFLATVFGNKLNQPQLPGEHSNATATGELPIVNVDPSGHLAPLNLSLRDYNHPDDNESDCEREVPTIPGQGKTAIVSSFDPADFSESGEMPLVSNCLPGPAAETKSRKENLNRRQTGLKVSAGRPDGAVRLHHPTGSQTVSNMRLHSPTVSQTLSKVRLNQTTGSQTLSKVRPQSPTVSQSLSKVRLQSPTVSQSLIKVRLNQNTDSQTLSQLGINKVHLQPTKASQAPGRVRTMLSA